MQLHRPKALDDLNVDFFSGDTPREEEKKDITSPGENDVGLELGIMYDKNESEETVDLRLESERKIPQLPNKDPSQPYSKSEILEFLAEDFSKLDNVLENATFTQEKEKEEVEHMKSEKQKESERMPLVDEKTALESFPDLSESIIDLAAKGGKQHEKEAIKKAKENAKNSIENEKKKIKEQKKLEKTVQRPFGKRRTTVVLTIIFLLIGILASAASAMIYTIDKSDNGLVKISSVSLGYVDGDKIDSPDHLGKYFLVKQGRIQGNDTLLFLYAGSALTLADVIGFGDGLYAVNMGNTVYRVAQTDILGCAKLKSPNLTVVRNIVVGYTFVVFAFLVMYMFLVILFSSMRIRKLNAVIKGLKESYELV